MRPVLIVVVACLGLAACGEREVEPLRAPVQLSVEAPADVATIDDDRVDIVGRVVPGRARVHVAGDEVGVEDGAFTTTVALEPGANVIDITAVAPRRPAAMTAIRVTRQVRVEVPDVADADPGDALDDLTAAGLRPELVDSGSLLDDLIGGDPGVCGTDPEAGAEVLPGAGVDVFVAPGC